MTSSSFKHWTVVRRVVQGAVFLLFCLPPLLVGWGLLGMIPASEDAMATPAEGVFYGSLSSSSVAGLNLVDPLAALETTVAARTIVPSVVFGALVVVVVYGLIRGRAFCGWVCPVNLLGEGVDALRRRAGITLSESVVPRRLKMGIALGMVVGSALLTLPLFELISPIGALNKGLIFGGFAGVGFLVAVLLVDGFGIRRLWCRSLCPLGGFYEAIGRAGLVSVHIDPQSCIHCDQCKAVCLADPVILTPVLEGETRRVKAGDCMACGRCIDVCPPGALRFGLGYGEGAPVDSAPSVEKPCNCTHNS